MKNARNKPPRKNINFNGNRHQPEIRDNLDSRKNEEQEFRGDDITHNKKDNHNKPAKKKS